MEARASKSAFRWVVMTANSLLSLDFFDLITAGSCPKWKILIPQAFYADVVK
jgi:hypothetical protein